MPTDPSARRSTRAYVYRAISSILLRFVNGNVEYRETRKQGADEKIWFLVNQIP